MAGPLARTCLAHLQTWRPYTLWYPGLVGLAGAALPGGAHPWWRMLLAWGAPTIGWVGGHYLGDYFDRRLDAIGKPHRPIPSGRLRPRAALAAGVACAVLSIVLALPANWRAVPLVAAALGGILAYSVALKGRGLSGNVVRGALTALVLAFGAMMTAPLPPWRALPFAAVFLIHDMASNLVGTLRDVDGDRAGGYRTPAVRHGVRPAARLAIALYALSIAVAVPSAWLVPASPAGYLTLLPIAAGCGAAAGILLLRRSGPPAPAVALRAHEVLVAERLVLAGAVLAGGVGPAPALAVLAPALAVSVVTQMTMRSRYEFPPARPVPPSPTAAPRQAAPTGAPPDAPTDAPANAPTGVRANAPPDAPADVPADVRADAPAGVAGARDLPMPKPSERR